MMGGIALQNASARDFIVCAYAAPPSAPPPTDRQQYQSHIAEALLPVFSPLAGKSFIPVPLAPPRCWLADQAPPYRQASSRANGSFNSSGSVPGFAGGTYGSPSVPPSAQRGRGPSRGKGGRRDDPDGSGSNRSGGSEGHNTHTLKCPEYLKCKKPATEHSCKSMEFRTEQEVL